MVLEIEIPDSILSIPKYSVQELLVDVAVALYQRKIYSLALAARFSGLEQPQFLGVLAERHVPVYPDLKIDVAEPEKVKTLETRQEANTKFLEMVKQIRAYNASEPFDMDEITAEVEFVRQKNYEKELAAAGHP